LIFKETVASNRGNPNHFPYHRNGKEEREAWAIEEQTGEKQGKEKGYHVW